MRALRRYHSLPDHAGWDCASGWHEARARLEDTPVIWQEERRVYTIEPREWPHDDPRWPTHCECGYAFTADDEWQLFYERLYRDPRDGREYGLRDAPTGAMWDATWLADIREYTERSPDGRILHLMLPDGTEWNIDSKAQNGPGWTRTGEPPRVSASPSILSPGYHGFLRDGVLTDDLEGRRYAAEGGVV